MIAIIDYGMGNLRSVQKALEKAGAATCITQDPREIQQAEKVVLPGVGAIKPAMEELNRLNLISVIKETVVSGKPFLGICVGLQLLFETSFEGGKVKGLGILPGTVERFTLPPALKVPHMGWNQIRQKNGNCPLMKGIEDKSNVYFCHSYYVKPAQSDFTATTTEYGVDFTSSVYKDNIFGVQFHPEKSQAVGLKILGNFVNLASQKALGN